MVKSKKIHEFTIEHNGDVANGLKYLEQNWDKEEIQEIFENARNSKDQDSNFKAYIGGGMKYYVLKHTGYDKYFLEIAL